jgi:DNA-binding MarR family transcriptional regulator
MQLEIHAMPGHLLRRMQQIAVAVFSGRIGATGHDITPIQFAAMSALASRPDIDQATLAAMIACDRATIGGVVERLEAKGYVRRSINRLDRRARRLELTPSGRAIYDRLLPAVRELQGEILAGLTAKERRTLCRLLAKASAAADSTP